MSKILISFEYFIDKQMKNVLFYGNSQYSFFLGLVRPTASPS